MNILSYPSALIQGRPGKIGRVQGNFSPFKIGRPIALLDAAKGLTLNGSGADLIDEDFATDPGWSVTGNAVVTGGELVATIAPGGGINRQSTTFAAQTEFWASCDFSTDVGFVIGTNGETVAFFDIESPQFAGRVEIVRDSGVLKFRTVTQDDGGFVTANLASPVFAVGTKYTVTMHWVEATSAISNDGVFQVWIDTALVTDEQTLDNNGRSATTVFVGAVTGPASSEGVIRIDNVKVGTTGASPAQASSVADQSGNGNDVLQAVAADQLLWTPSSSNFNNNPALIGDGVSEFMQSVAFASPLAQPFISVSVFKFDSVVGNNMIFDSIPAEARCLIQSTTSTIIMNAGTSSRIIQAADTNPHILIVLWDGASSNSWLDGVEGTPSGDPGTNDLGGLSIFGDISGNVNMVGEQPYTFLMPGSPSDIAINYLGNGLAARFGTTWTDI